MRRVAGVLLAAGAAAASPLRGDLLCSLGGNWTGSFAKPTPPANKDTYTIVQTSSTTWNVTTGDEKWDGGTGTLFQRADGTYYVRAVLDGDIELTGCVCVAERVLKKKKKKQNKK